MKAHPALFEGEGMWEGREKGRNKKGQNSEEHFYHKQLSSQTTDGQDGRDGVGSFCRKLNCRKAIRGELPN